MTYLTSHAQVAILNNILPFLLFDKVFNIADEHRNKILLGLNLKKDGTPDIDKIDATTITLTNNGTYKAITGFLVDNKFADPINDEPTNHDYVLTPKGEYLAAHGNLDAYELSISLQLTEEEIKLRMPSVLAVIEPYSEFQLVAEPRPKNSLILSYHEGQTEKERLEYAFEMTTKHQREFKEMVLKEQLDLIKDERVAQYLVHQGFAINRHDVKQAGRTFRQLTDKGRELKECGTIEVFNQRVAESNRKKLLQDRRIDYLYWINFWIMIGALSAAVYYVVQTVDYFSVLISKHLHLYYGYAVTVYLVSLGVLIGVSASIIMLLRRKAKIKKQSNTT